LMLEEEFMTKSRANPIKKSSANRLVLIDGHAILHRAYHALPPLTIRSGELVNAVYGFTTMLLKVISDLKPKYLAVAFDTEKPTFRQAEYIGYQAQRPKMEEELKGQIEKVYEVLAAMGIPIFEKEGFEADDVIGTLARQACRTEKRGKKKTRKNAEKIEVVIVTGDRDMMQLIGPRVRVYAPIKGLSEAQFFDEEKVQREIGVRPGQIVDFKGLTGDPSDNYPGVPGIGPKTARELLEKFKTLEKIYKSLDEAGRFFNPSVVGKLAQGKESAQLSKKLATIICDVPIKLDLKKCEFEFSEEEREKAIKKFKELGFKSLVERLATPASAKASAGRQKTQKKRQGEGQLKLV